MTNIKRERIVMVTAAVIAWLTLWWVGWQKLDPDFGWHVRVGDYIINHGIPQTDPLSFTMGNFPFVDHEWLTNILMAWLYPRIGMAGWAAIAATLIIITGAIAIPRKYGKGAIIGWTLGLAILMLRFGVRPQILDWLGVAIVWRWAAEEKTWNKWRWGIPLLFGVWANLHGGFAVGVALTGWIIAWKCIQERKIRWGDGFIWLAGVGITFVNPYGWRLWGEVAMQITDGTARKYIGEWLPFYMAPELGFPILAALTASLVWIFRKEVAWWKIATTTGLLAAGVLSNRHVALFAVTGGALGAEMMNIFIEKLSINKEAARRVGLVVNIILGITAAVLAVEGGMAVWTVASKRTFPYPIQAVEFLKQKNYAGNLFNDYGWGGYLDWKYQGKKVFVDGRMATWKWKSNDPSQSDYIFGEYIKIEKGEEAKQIIDKYGITTVLWKKPGPKELRWKVWNFLEVGRGNGDGKSKLLEWLQENGWKKVYEDKVAVVYHFE